MTTDLLEPDLAPVYQAWKTKPGPDTGDALLQAVKPHIDRAISAHVGQDNPLIRSRAKLMFLKQLPTYDPSRAGLATFTFNQLRSLKRVNRQQTQILRLPEQMLLQQGALAEAEGFLRDEHDRDPSDAELSAHTGLSRKRIQQIREFHQPLAESTAAGEFDYQPQATSAAKPTGPRNRVAELLYDELHPIDQLIMEHSLGLHGKPVLKNMEIAARLKVTPGAISQRKLSIQRRLDALEQTRTV